VENSRREELSKLAASIVHQCRTNGDFNRNNMNYLGGIEVNGVRYDEYLCMICRERVYVKTG